jgi:hypothetical protein
MSDEIERIAPATPNPALRPQPESDPYSAENLFCTSGKDNVYRFVYGPEGGIASVEGVPEEEQFFAQMPKKKPKTNKRGNRWL